MTGLAIATPTNILLTGAGFTKNFGGLLAVEVWSRIFNHTSVRGVPGLASKVSVLAPDFEAVYDEVVVRDPTTDEAKAVHKATLAAYDTLDQKLQDPMGPQSKLDVARIGEMVKLCGPTKDTKEVGFLFTLNQDLLPERKTVGKLHFGDPQILGFGGLPGHYGTYLEQGDGAPLTKKDVRRCPSQEQIEHGAPSWLHGGQFYWVKLHGSSNWRDAAGNDLMVLGHGKMGQIQAEPLLSWYWGLFKSALLSRRHRLFVIGYSFRDEHVNEVIAESVATKATELVVVNPAPWEQFKNSLVGLPRCCRGPELVRSIEGGGGSRYWSATLLEMFPYETYGSETVEWQELKQLLRSPLAD